MKCSERAKRETGFSCATKAEMLKYYRCYKFSLLPFKSRSSYVIFCEVFFPEPFLFCFSFFCCVDSERASRFVARSTSEIKEQ